jgi:hypothetical protein
MGGAADLLHAHFMMPLDGLRPAALFYTAAEGLLQSL